MSPGLTRLLRVGLDGGFDVRLAVPLRDQSRGQSRGGQVASLESGHLVRQLLRLVAFPNLLRLADMVGEPPDSLRVVPLNQPVRQRHHVELAAPRTVGKLGHDHVPILPRPFVVARHFDERATVLVVLDPVGGEPDLRLRLLHGQILALLNLVGIALHIVKKPIG